MYRIALQITAATATRPATYQFISDAGSAEPWGTTNKQEALDRYVKELSNYKRDILILVNVLDVELICEDSDDIQQ